MSQPGFIGFDYQLDHRGYILKGTALLTPMTKLDDFDQGELAGNLFGRGY